MSDERKRASSPRAAEPGELERARQQPGELTHGEARMLDAARRAFAPAPGTAERVLAGTLQVVASSALGADAGDPQLNQHAPGPEQPSVTTRSAATAGHALRATVWPKLVPLALSLMGASGVAGYVLGYRDGRAAQDAQAAPPAQPELQARVAPKLPAKGPSARAEPPASEPQAAPEPRDSPAPRAARQPELARRPAPAAPGSQPAADPGSLETELRALRQIEQALRDQAPQRALSLLNELDRDVPHGRLVEEREAAFTLARCQLGAGDKPRLYDAFARAYPNSVYRERMAGVCKPDAEPEP